MKKLFLVRRITMIMFLIVLFGFSCLNLTYSLPYIREVIVNEHKDKELGQSKDEDLHKSVEDVIEDEVLFKDFFVESYEYIQKLININ